MSGRGPWLPSMCRYAEEDSGRDGQIQCSRNVKTPHMEMVFPFVLCVPLQHYWRASLTTKQGERASLGTGASRDNRVTEQ